MKKILLVAAAAMMVAISANAQQVQVVDSNGNAIPYAIITNSAAEYIGITDFDGILADVAGAKNISITHVAYKVKNVKLDGKDTVITLEDVDFDVPEMPAQSKPFIYVQVYFRMFYCTSPGAISYYRAGLTDNICDIVKDTVTANTNVIAKAKDIITKENFDKWIKEYDRNSWISPNFLRYKYEERFRMWSKPLELTFTDIAPGKKRISDDRSTIGYIIDNLENKKCHKFYDYQQILLRKMELSGSEEEKIKWDKHEENVRNRKRRSYSVCNIDDKESLEFPIMYQYVNSYDFVGKGGDIPCIVALQMFVTDRCYVTKEELKKRLKSNKIKMDYLNIRQFEYDHNIPPLPTAIQKEISEMWGTVE